MSDEFSYKQIAFDLDTKKMGEHFPRYNIDYSKLKNTWQKERRTIYDENGDSFR